VWCLTDRRQVTPGGQLIQEMRQDRAAAERGQLEAWRAWAS